MSQVFISKKSRNSGSIISLKGHYYSNYNDKCFQEIAQIKAIHVRATMGHQLLITLTVPDVWCDKANDWAWFAIKVNGEILTRGLITSGADGQRVPISLQTVVDVKDDHDYEIKAAWCNGAETENRNCYIGEYSEAVLTVLQLD